MIKQWVNELFLLLVRSQNVVFIFSPSLAGHLDPGFLASDKTSAGNAPLNEEINIASSDSEVEIVGVQEHAR